LAVARGGIVPREANLGAPAAAAAPVAEPVAVAAADVFESPISPSYLRLKAFNVGVPRIRDGLIAPGRVTVSVEGDPEFIAQGTLNSRGVLSGMAKLHHRLALADGDVLRFSIPRPGHEALLVIYPMPDGRGAVPEPPAPAAQPPRVFARMNLRHIHIEPFRPEGLESWEPETEVDVYLAFGVLQEYTDLRYCCGASAAILAKLGAHYAGDRPDAILIDRVTDEYLMAEWKMRSSAFKRNHAPEDVDVLVCWLDDETDRAVVPSRVVALYEIARIVAAEAINGG
jgi:hypothetical protein